MYYSRKNSMLSPRNGHTLVVGIVARISGCTNQKELSLEDQVDHAKEEIAQCYDGAVEYRIIATKGKGERLDRPELAETEEMLRSRELDVLVAEDIGQNGQGALRLSTSVESPWTMVPVFWPPTTASTRRTIAGRRT